MRCISAAVPPPYEVPTPKTVKNQGWKSESGCACVDNVCSQETFSRGVVLFQPSGHVKKKKGLKVKISQQSDSFPVCFT